MDDVTNAHPEDYEERDNVPKQSRTDYPGVVRSVMKVVTDGDGGAGSSTSMEMLSSKVKADCGFDNVGCLKVIVNTMIGSGVLDGYVVAGSIKSVRLPKKQFSQPGKPYDNKGGSWPPAGGTKTYDAGFSEGRAKAAKEFDQQLEAIRKQTQAKTTELTKAVEDLKAELAAAKGATRVVEVILRDAKGKAKKTTKGTFNKAFERVLQLAQARRNIFLYGPTGSGKTFLCGQVAEALGLDYSFISCTGGTSEGLLTGKLLPIGANGKWSYVPAGYVERYEKGGLFLFDEIDALDANTMLTVNTSLAGNELSVPNRPDNPVAKRHKDFVCIAAANTLGGGASRLYAGRNKLDMSTLDRFLIGKVLVDYDPVVEEVLCPDVELRVRLVCYREAINAHGLERAVSTRFMADAYIMASQHGWTAAEIDEALMLGWREDEINRLKDHYRKHEGQMRLKMALPKVTAAGAAVPGVAGVTVEEDDDEEGWEIVGDYEADPL